MTRPALARGLNLLLSAWHRLSIYLPVILIGLLALATYWLVRNTPLLLPPSPEAAPRHEVDYYMKGFLIQNFGPNGQRRHWLTGDELRHFPDTDTFEVLRGQARALNAAGHQTQASADLMLSNADGSEIQLIGRAKVVRDAIPGRDGPAQPRLEFRGEFLHIFLDNERLKSHKPVELIRGRDRFTADSLYLDRLDQVLELQGRVRGTLMPAPDTVR